MSELKILLQQHGQQNFFKTFNTWTEDANEAKSFPSALSAFDFARQHQLEGVEVVFQMAGAPVQKIITERSIATVSKSCRPTHRKSLVAHGKSNRRKPTWSTAKAV